MRPEEVLYSIKECGEDFAVPQVYRGMSHHQLADLAAEIQKPSSRETLQKCANQMGWPKEMRTAVIEAEHAAIAAWKAGLIPPPIAGGRAGAKRLSTPARRRAAFLKQLMRCSTIAEAAARSGIDRRTVSRWRRAFPAFAARCEAVIAERRRIAIEDVVLAAARAETRPVFHRGIKVGEYTVRDRALALYLLKQADAEALRAEKRRETEAAIEARIQEEVERRISAMSRSAGHPAEATTEESARPAEDLTTSDATPPRRADVPENVPSPDVPASDIRTAGVPTAGSIPGRIREVVGDSENGLTDSPSPRVWQRGSRRPSGRASRSHAPVAFTS